MAPCFETALVRHEPMLIGVERKQVVHGRDRVWLQGVGVSGFARHATKHAGDSWHDQPSTKLVQQARRQQCARANAVPTASRASGLGVGRKHVEGMWRACSCACDEV